MSPPELKRVFVPPLTGVALSVLCVVTEMHATVAIRPRHVVHVQQKIMKPFPPARFACGGAPGRWVGYLMFNHGFPARPQYPAGLQICGALLSTGMHSLTAEHSLPVGTHIMQFEAMHRLALLALSAVSSLLE